MAAIGSLLTAAPAPADAVRPVPENGIATCVRDAGPGELTLQAPAAATPASTLTDLLTASPERIERAAGVDLGPLLACPEVASGGGVTAVAGVVVGAGSQALTLRVAVRDAESAFAEPATLADVSADGTHPVVAVGPRGDVVVAWREVRRGSRAGDSVRIMAARRPAAPGASWGPPEEIVPWRPQDDFASGASLAAGVDGQGRATVAWALAGRDGEVLGNVSAVGVSSGAPGEPLRSSSLGRLQEVGGLALAVAPDGGAVLAVSADQTLRAFERPPGDGAFAPSEPLDRSYEGIVTQTAVALDPSGAALVAWSLADQSDESRPRVRLLAARRPAGGRFGAPVSVWSQRVRNEEDSGGGSIAISVDGPPLEEKALRARLTGDGRAAIAWVDSRPVDGDSVPAGYLATSGPDERYAVATLGSPCRAVNAVAPFAGADGDLLSGWTDNVTDRLAEEYEIPRQAGRLHVDRAPPAAPASASAAPGVVATAVGGPQKLWRAQPALLVAVCDGPCDLRAFVPGDDGPVFAGGGTVTSAGRTRLRLYPGIDSLTQSRPRTLPVVVHACSPDGTSRSSTTTKVRVIRRRPPPVPAPLGVRATPTAGGNVIVTWHTAFPARRSAFLVLDQTRHNPQSFGPAPAYRFVEGRSRTRVTPVLRAVRGQTIRQVRVEPYSLEGIRAPRGVDVPVGD